jgi:hypothetical protein
MSSPVFPAATVDVPGGWIRAGHILRRHDVDACDGNLSPGSEFWPDE